MPRYEHDMSTEGQIKRLMKKVSIRENGCWIYTGAPSPNGYINIAFYGRQESAHKASYILHNGNVPDGMFVCHHCDTPACINPEHLFLGSHQDNMDDMMQKGRVPDRKGERAGRSILSETDVVSIRSLYKTGKYREIDLAGMYFVSRPTVNAILTRRSWTHIP